MKKKQVFGFILSGSLVFSLFSNNALANEVDSNDEVGANDELDTILLDFGFDEEEIQYLPIEKKLEFANTIEEDPEKISVNSNITSVDNIETIEYYVNTSDEALLSEGFTTDEVEDIREKIDVIKSYSDSHLQNIFDLSKGEVLIIKDVLKEKDYYQPPLDFGEKGVSTSGSIATSKLKFSMVVVNKSTSKAPKYNVTLNHTWKSPYFFDIVKDNVAAAWGGNLAAKDFSSLVYYVKANWYTQKYGNAWGSVVASKTLSPNTGVVFSFDQHKDWPSGGVAHAKSGTFWFTLYQDKKVGMSTSIVSQYAHKKMTVSNISVSKTPGIVIGSGKDVSEQEDEAIKY